MGDVVGGLFGARRKGLSDADAPAYSDLLDDVASGLPDASVDDASVSLDAPAAPDALGPVRRQTFSEFKEAVLLFVRDAPATIRAQLQLLQVARRRDFSCRDCDALMRTLTDAEFVAIAYGATAACRLPTTWKAVSNQARALLRALQAFIPEVSVRDCCVRTGSEPGAHSHSGRVAFLVGSATWAFMLLDIELFSPFALVRPVASAGESAVVGVHPSWSDHVGAGGAGHPSFAPLTLAREATIIAANPHATLRAVPFPFFVGIDGVHAGKTPGRSSLISLYARNGWLPHRRLHDKRAYMFIALIQLRKLSEAAAADDVVSPVLRSALIQQLLRECLCNEETLAPFESTLPGERESVLLVPYVAGLVLDYGEVVYVAGCGGGGKSCSWCLCSYANLGGPVTQGCCAGGGTFRDGAATAAWATARATAGTTFARSSRAEEAAFRSKPVQLAISEPVVLRSLPTQDVSTAFGVRLPAALRERKLVEPDQFHNLEEGEFAKGRPRFKTLLLNWFRHRNEGDSKAAVKAAYRAALDAVDVAGTEVLPHALPGRRTITQYHAGWISATAFFGWDHLNIFYMLPMLLGFNDRVLPTQLKRRVVKAFEAVLEVHRLAYAHGKDAAACLERKEATIRYGGTWDLWQRVVSGCTATVLPFSRFLQDVCAARPRVSEQSGVPWWWLHIRARVLREAALAPDAVPHRNRRGGPHLLLHRSV